MKLRFRYIEFKPMVIDWYFINRRFVFGSVRFFVINKNIQIKEFSKLGFGNALFGVHIFRSEVKIEWLYKDIK